MDGLAVTMDPTYFLRWDFIVLLVEDTLFRIPRNLLLTHSDYLKDQFESRSTEGSSAVNPFIIDGVTAEDFRSFLRIILPFVNAESETVWTKAEWLSALKISSLWHCLNLRNIAISELESDRHDMKLTSVEKIVLGRKYSIFSWVEDGYTSVVNSRAAITDEQMQSIGTLESFKLMRMISIRQTGGYVIDAKHEFREELKSIAAAEKAYKKPDIESTRVKNSKKRRH